MNLPQKKREEYIKNHSNYYSIVKTIIRKRKVLLPFTQLLFDPKGTLIELSAYLRRKSKLYEKYFDIVRGYR